MRDRIDFSMFSEDAPQVELKATDFERFLPTATDLVKLKDNICILIARILVKYIPAFTTISDIISEHISHQYSSEMSRNSEVVSGLKCHMATLHCIKYSNILSQICLGI